MNTCIEKCRIWFKAHPKAREWAWFIALWLFGFMCVSAIAYPIKLLIRGMSQG